MIAPAWILAVVTIAGPVSLRDGSTIEPERIGAYTTQGIELTTGFEPGQIGGRSLVPWAEVRSITGGWGEAEPYRAVADALWRATTRLRRGDATGAAAALEPFADAYLNERGPTSGALAGVLTAARLLGPDRPGALRAWLSARSSGFTDESSWIDPETGLCTALPPVFRPEEAPGVRAMEPTVGDATTDGLRALYHAAALLAAGEDAQLPDLTARQRADPGLRLVLDVVRARAETDPPARQAARDALERRMRDGAPAWQSAWIDLGVGLSMMCESEPQTRDAGASRLVTVVIEHQLTAPGLSELARDLLIEYFASTGRPHHEAAVRSMDRAALLGLSPWSGDPEEERNQTGAASPDEEFP